MGMQSLLLLFLVPHLLICWSVFFFVEPFSTTRSAVVSPRKEHSWNFEAKEEEEQEVEEAVEAARFDRIAS